MISHANQPQQSPTQSYSPQKDSYEREMTSPHEMIGYTITPPNDTVQCCYCWARQDVSHCKLLGLKDLWCGNAGWSPEEIWEQTVVFRADTVTAKISSLPDLRCPDIYSYLPLLRALSTADTSASSDLTLGCPCASFQLSGLTFADRMTLQLSQSCLVWVTWLMQASLIRVQIDRSLLTYDER